MNISINAISAKVGGGATYLQSILPELARQLGEGHRVIVWRSAAGEYSWPREFEYREDARAAGEAERSASITQRLWFDQIEIPRQLRAERTDVLFSTANFGTLRSPCHQVLLVCNTLPFDRTYLSRLSAKARAHWNLQRQLVMLSIRAADVVIFPTTAIRDLVATYFGKTPDNWIVSNFGTRHDLFRPALEQRNVEGPL
ncbi:MAG TPA: glycosyltransferase, partial [Blastocatellia bacterium]|nr:glycosyltransferase [Blastocatellia bacterium]